jgi:hypothetical protein
LAARLSLTGGCQLPSCQVGLATMQQGQSQFRKAKTRLEARTVTVRPYTTPGVESSVPDDIPCTTLGTYDSRRKVAGSIPDVTGFFKIPNPSSRTIGPLNRLSLSQK